MIMAHKNGIHLGKEYYSLLRSLKRSSYSDGTVLLIENLASSIYEVTNEERKKYLTNDLRHLTVGDGFTRASALGSMVHCFIPFERGVFKMEVEIKCIRWENNPREHLSWGIDIKNDTSNGENEYYEMHTIITYKNYRTKTTKVCRIPWRKYGLHYVK